MAPAKFDIYLFIKLSIKSIALTVLWIPAFIYRLLLIKYIEKFQPKYGKIFGYNDLGLVERYWETPPKTTLVFTLNLEGQLKLEALRKLFQQNVLDAKVHDKETGQDQLRYPEFMQYEADFGGYKFWKDDPTFNLSNHTSEESYSIKKHEPLSEIHKEFQNKLYQKMRSPWEIVIIQNYLNDSKKSLLVYRSHHSFSDTKSVLKVLVECLAQKELQIPNAHYPYESLLNKIKYYVCLPFYFVYVQMYGQYIALKGSNHPWKFKGGNEVLNVGISKKKISMDDIKLVAKESHVTPSAIIMSAITGGVVKICPALQNGDGLCQWILPKANHPDKLTNHHLSAAMDLPTSVEDIAERMKKCDQIFHQLKASYNLWKYMKVVQMQNTTWFNPVRDYLMSKRAVFPLIITNIAGDATGFDIGNCRCSEMSFTCGPLPGSRGALICTFSYKGMIEVTVASREEILSNEEAQRLADAIYDEFSNICHNSKK